MKKSIFKSKTFIVNLIVGVLSIIAVINPEILSVFGLTGVSQTNALTLIGAFVAVLNVILRMITTEPVSFPKSNTPLMIITLVLMSYIAFADTIPFDSTKLNHGITNAVNSGIALIPEPTPVITVIKAIWMGAGTLITGFFMGIFIRRNKKNAKK